MKVFQRGEDGRYRMHPAASLMVCCALGFRAGVVMREGVTGADKEMDSPDRKMISGLSTGLPDS